MRTIDLHRTPDQAGYINGPRYLDCHYEKRRDEVIEVDHQRRASRTVMTIVYINTGDRD